MTRAVIKNALAVLLVGSLLSACNSSKNATGTPTRSNVKGTWLLNNISYEGLSSGEKLKVTLLDEGSEACLKGSTWVLPNNGYGSYNLTSSAAGCTAGERSIVWSYREENGQAIFQFKKLPGGVKAKDIKDGYRFRIMSADKAAMLLQSEVNYQGSPIRINYSFSRQ